MAAVLRALLRGEYNPKRHCMIPVTLICHVMPCKCIDCCDGMRESARVACLVSLGTFRTKNTPPVGNQWLPRNVRHWAGNQVKCRRCSVVDPVLFAVEIQTGFRCCYKTVAHTIRCRNTIEYLCKTYIFKYIYILLLLELGS